MTTEHRAADERRHDPGPEPWWAESWHFDFVGDPDRPSALGGFVQLAFYPGQRTAWFWAALVGDELGLVVVRDHDVAIPQGRALEVRAGGLWAELTCEAPFEHWGIGLEAFGVRLDDPLDALGDERGERLPVGLDLEWEADAPPADLIATDDGSVRHYEHPGTLHGELAVGDRRLRLVGRGERDHSWGPRDWWATSWHWAAYRLGSNRALTLLDVGGGAFTAGYRWSDRRDPVRIRDFHVETHLDGRAFPTAARHSFGGADGGGEVDVEVLHVAPIPVRSPDGRLARYLRALCRFTDPTSEAVGTGWAEWLQPPTSDAPLRPKMAR